MLIIFKLGFFQKLVGSKFVDIAKFPLFLTL